MNHASDELLSFWFGDTPRSEADVSTRMQVWFAVDPDFDAQIAERYQNLADAAAHNELQDWGLQPRQRLALILALDQLPRNIYRGDALAFAQDKQALDLATDGLSSGMDRQLTPLERLFFYMPLQHSEHLEIQEISVAAYEQLMQDAGELEKFALAVACGYAKQHRDMVARFGRFPYRNHALGREETSDERSFFEQDGPTFGQ